jgi:hypothetical protein
MKLVVCGWFTALCANLKPRENFESGAKRRFQNFLCTPQSLNRLYCEGELEIMGNGLLHEMISSLLGMLLVSYFFIKRIRFTSTGAYTQTIEPRLEFQADLSFAFGNDPAKTDLCMCTQSLFILGYKQSK